MTVKGGTTPACAACKYQRRKCSPACPLAPYFPANEPKKFQNVHRLFGVSNVTKTLERLTSKDLKEDAMKSIIYEADIREKFPIDGCLAVIAQLNADLHFAVEELNYVRAALDTYRDHAIAAGCDDMASTVPPQFLLGEGGGGMCPERPPPPPDHCYNTMNSSLSSIQAQMDALGIQNKNCFDFEAQHFITNSIFDESQIYNNATKIEAFESSPELSSLDVDEEHGRRRDTVAAERGCRKELRSAAAGFSLTTVN